MNIMQLTANFPAHCWYREQPDGNSQLMPEFFAYCCLLVPRKNWLELAADRGIPCVVFGWDNRSLAIDVEVVLAVAMLALVDILYLATTVRRPRLPLMLNFSISIINALCARFTCVSLVRSLMLNAYFCKKICVRKLFFVKHRLHWGHRMLQSTSQMPRAHWDSLQSTSQMPRAHWDSNKAECRLCTPASSHVILSLRKRHIRSTTKTHTLSSKVIHPHCNQCSN